jgi:hypothetical protein
VMMRIKVVIWTLMRSEKSVEGPWTHERGAKCDPSNWMKFTCPQLDQPVCRA